MSPSSRTSLERTAKLLEEGKRVRDESARLIANAKAICSHIGWLIDQIKRQRDPSYFLPLQVAISVMHGCETEHLNSFGVRKVCGETVLWDGIVEEFRLLGHPQADRCYGWTYTEAGNVRHFSLLKVLPVDSPQAAVQTALAARELVRDGGPPTAAQTPPPSTPLVSKRRKVAGAKPSQRTVNH